VSTSAGTRFNGMDPVAGRRIAFLAAGLLFAVAACGSVKNPVPQTATSTGPASPVVAVSGSEACAAADVGSSPDLGNGIWHGHVTDDFTIANISRAICYVPASPRVTITEAGTPAVVVDPGGETVGQLRLYPQQSVEVAIGCDSGGTMTATSVTIALSAKDPKTVDGMRLPRPCTNPHLLAFQQGPGPSPTGIGALIASVTLPASVRIGGELRYTVTLANGTSAAVRLSPCPSYTEHLSAPLTPGFPREDLTRPLSCATGSINAGSSLTFAMAMPVPSTWQPGAAKFLWNLEVYGQPAAGGVINLE
jgi:hypothetical protein